MPPGDWGVISWDSVSKDEKSEFKDKVLAKLRSLSIDVTDAELVAEFITCMVGEDKSHQEMVQELQFLDSEADSFVAWVEACKDRVLSRSKGAQVRQPAQLTPNPSRGALAHASPAAVLTPAPRHATPPRRAADPSSPERSPKGGIVDKAGVVVTKRLVLQPAAPEASDGEEDNQAKRPDRSPSRSSSSSSRSGSSADEALEKDAEEAAADPDAKVVDPVEERRLLLLDDMTKKLQVILAKLSDKTLDDKNREKYQALAQTIQASITKISAPDADEEWPAA